MSSARASQRSSTTHFCIRVGANTVLHTRLCCTSDHAAQALMLHKRCWALGAQAAPTTADAA